MLVVLEQERNLYYVMVNNSINMGKRKSKEIAIEHYKSQLNIHQHFSCQECPIRIYADKNECITFGAGITFAKTIFILPTYDTNAKIGYTTIFTLLSDLYKELFGKNILEDIYITRLVKCINKSTFNLESIAAKRCFVHLNTEIVRGKWDKIVFFGNTFEEYMDANPHPNYHRNLINKYIENNKCFQLYNPGVLYYDNKAKDIFIEQLKQVMYDSI